MLANVQQTTIKPIIEAAVARGTLVHTDEYKVYARLPAWGYRHKTVCHGRGEYARHEDGDGRLDDRLDRLLLHIGQHAHDDLPTALDQAENRWLVLLQRAAARRSRQSATASKPPLFATAAGWPLCPATT